MIFDYCIEKAVDFFRSIETGLAVACAVVFTMTVIAAVYSAVSIIGEYIRKRKGL